jgi:uncharacterized protein
MNSPLMPKATAAWLIKNTTLTFEQIASFCELHNLEVQSIADGETASLITEENPIVNGELTREEITKCEKDPNAQLQMLQTHQITVQPSKRKHPRYTPIARRQDKPDAIMWVLKNYPDLSDNQMIKLLGTTKVTISAIKNREHWNTPNIRARDPVLLGICSQVALNEAIQTIKTPPNKQKTTTE